MTKNSFDKVAENWIKTHATAFERRYHEMVQVIETLKEMGVEPVMTQGTTDFFKRSCALGLEQAFKTKPESFWEVPDEMEMRLRGQKN
jgi:hypothetical protein